VKKQVFIVIYGIISMLLWADILPSYELDFTQNEEVIIKKNNLISKQAARDLVQKAIYEDFFSNIDTLELKALVKSSEVILVEEITPEAAREMTYRKYYYSVQVRAKDGRLLYVGSINAQNSEFIHGIFCDNKYVDDSGIEKIGFVTLLDRSEVISYVKKYFTFPAESKITLHASYDHSFYSDFCGPNTSTNWKYRITIEDGLFKSAAYPEGITTLFVSPYTAGWANQKAEPTPDNDIIIPLTHRIYAYQSAVKSQTQTTSNKALPVASPADTYVGLD